MESISQNMQRGNPATGRAPPLASTGTLGKFGSFWMPKSSQEIAQRTGLEQGLSRDEKAKSSREGKGAREAGSPKTAFRDIISQKEDARPSKTQARTHESSQQVKSEPVKGKNVRPEATSTDRFTTSLTNTKTARANAKAISPERVVAEKPSTPIPTRKESQETLKYGKGQKERGLDQEERHEKQDKRDRGTDNAKRGRANQVQGLGATKNTMTAVKPEANETTVLSGRLDSEANALDPAGSSRSSGEGFPAGRFLQSDEQSQRNARHVFSQLRQRIGDFMDGNARVARLAIDLPGGGRLGIKIRFLGDRLEIIFATEDPAMRAALIENWNDLSRHRGSDESRLLPPAFADNNYTGISRDGWTEAA